MYNLHRLAAQPVLLAEHLNKIIESERLAAVKEKDRSDQTVLHLAAETLDSLRAVLALYPEAERLAASGSKRKR